MEYQPSQAEDNPGQIVEVITDTVQQLLETLFAGFSEVSTDDDAEQDSPQFI